MTDVVDQEIARLISKRASADTRTAADEREERLKASVGPPPRSAGGRRVAAVGRPGEGGR